MRATESACTSHIAPDGVGDTTTIAVHDDAPIEVVEVDVVVCKFVEVVVAEAMAVEVGGLVDNVDMVE